MLGVVFALMLQQAAPGPVVWSTPVAPAPTVEAAPIPVIPDSARADPHGYERAECSPLVRAASESMEACQTRVRFALAANLRLSATAEEVEDCRQTPAGDRYALQCGSPTPADRPTTVLTERTCETRPQAQARGGVAWSETCKQDGGRPAEQDGLKFRLGGRD